jgi:hypothetical protein
MVGNVGSLYGEARFRMYGVRTGRQCLEYRESVWGGNVQNRRTITFDTVQQQEGVGMRGR